ncbi:MAG: diadenylate cyclase [Planctomycetia bacterium]|nr:diadenylate cyclase [Planctomycetia bacterium]
MLDRLTQLYDTTSTRDLVEIVILAVAIFLVLRFLGKTRGAGIVRGLGLIVVGLFLTAQVVIAGFELKVLGRVLDYLLTTVLLGLAIIFQPELRQGLMLLGRSPLLRWFVRTEEHPVAERLADAAEAMSRECVGALIVIEREMSLAPYIENGQRLDAELSASLLRALFCKRSPLHDGAIIITGGRIAAAGCQLPLGQPPENASVHMGMRHRSALCMSDETDAVLLVVSEETGRISIGIAGRLEPIPRDNLLKRLTVLLESGTANHQELDHERVRQAA